MVGRFNGRTKDIEVEFSGQAQLVFACLQILRSLTMSEKQQQLVYSIIEFLNQSIQEGTIKADDQEGVEVASA